MPIDPTTSWLADPRVAPLLAACAANPPAVAEHRKTFVITTDVWCTYKGALPSALHAIHDEYTTELLAAANMAGTDEAWAGVSAHFDELTVDQAIAGAVQEAEDTADRAMAAVAELRLAA